MTSVSAGNIRLTPNQKGAVATAGSKLGPPHQELFALPTQLPPPPPPPKKKKKIGNMKDFFPL